MAILVQKPVFYPRIVNINTVPGVDLSSRIFLSKLSVSANTMKEVRPDHHLAHIYPL